MTQHSDLEHKHCFRISIESLSQYILITCRKYEKYFAWTQFMLIPPFSHSWTMVRLNCNWKPIAIHDLQNLLKPWYISCRILLNFERSSVRELQLKPYRNTYTYITCGASYNIHNSTLPLLLFDSITCTSLSQSQDFRENKCSDNHLHSLPSVYRFE